MAKHDSWTRKKHRSHVSGKRFRKTSDGRNLKDVLSENARCLEEKYVKKSVPDKKDS